LVSAWAWGAWAFLLVVPNDERNYGYTWIVKAFLEALFFASGFLFLEKFILQLIGEHLSSIKDTIIILLIKDSKNDSYCIPQVSNLM
jgi:hypothetical protein